MCNNTRCHFAITDIVDVDENIEVILFCSYHDCLPDDAPVGCNANEVVDEYTDAMVDYYLDEQAEEYEDEVPF